MHGLLSTDLDSGNIMENIGYPTPTYSANSAVIGDVKVKNRVIPTPDGPKRLTTVEKPFEDENGGLQGATLKGTGLTIINSNPTYPTNLESKEDKMSYIDIHEIGHFALDKYFSPEPLLEELENRKLHDEYFQILKGKNPDTAGDMLRQLEMNLKENGYSSDKIRKVISNIEEKTEYGCRRIKKVIKDSNLNILGFYRNELENRERQKYIKNLEYKTATKMPKYLGRNCENEVSHRDTLTGKFIAPKNSSSKSNEKLTYIR